MAVKCKEHPLDQGIGVCAFCLRARLIDLEVQQSRRRSSEEKLQRDEIVHPPIIFPRSVSPYVAQRRSIDLEAQIHPRENLRFFSTPQAGPAIARSKPSGGGFFTSIFNRENKSKSSWFSALIPGRRKKTQQERDALWQTPPVRSSLAAAGVAAHPSPLTRPIPRRSHEGESSGMAGAREIAGHHRRRKTVGGGDLPTLGHNRSRKIADLGKLR